VNAAIDRVYDNEHDEEFLNSLLMTNYMPFQRIKPQGIWDFTSKQFFVASAIIQLGRPSRNLERRDFQKCNSDKFLIRLQINSKFTILGIFLAGCRNPTVSL